MAPDDLKLVTALIASNSKHREIAFSFLNIERDFRRELREHMDTKVELARLKAENEFLLKTIEDYENQD